MSPIFNCVEKIMRPLTYKLTLSFLVVSLTGILLVAILAGGISARAYDTALESQAVTAAAANLADYYARNRDWSGVEQFVGTLDGFASGSGQMRRTALADATGHIIVPGAGFSRNTNLTAATLASGVAITLDGERVGTLLVTSGQEHTGMMATQQRTLFATRLRTGLILAALGAAAIALVLGVLLARNLTRPLQELTSATRAVARGEWGQTVPVRSQDEIGELAQAFNQMNVELARGRQLRRQMTADIAHELRTPLSLILGHAEAMQDGILPPTPDTLAIIHDEARRLNRLVDDLRTLSLADAGELTLLVRPVASQELLTNAAASFRPQAQQKQVELRTEIAPDLPEVQVDPDRMAQVLTNLLANALRYTPERGRVTLRALLHADGVEWQVQDNGPGIAVEEVPHLFDRFYRGDKSRHRAEGGSGLGLAIVRSLVEAHKGRVWVDGRSGEGAIFHLVVPVAGAER
ncbi:MAG: ATP-binding protein [Candidatus Promineifilaceae bacterium]